MKHVIRTHLLTSCILLLGALAARAAADTSVTAEFARLKQEACQPFQADFDRIAAASKADPAMQQFQERLALIDKVTGLVILDLESCRSHGNARLATAQDSNLTVHQTLGALKLLADFQQRFALDLPLPAVGDQDRQILCSYHQACIRARSQYLFWHGQVIAAVNPDATRTIMELSLVLPFLNVPDDAWSATQIQDLPAWMQQPANLRALEELAIRAHRLHAAFQFSRFAKSPTAGPADQASYASYLDSAVDVMLRSQDYTAAAYCLKAGMQQAKAANSRRAYVEYAFRLAEVTASGGDNAAAAQQMRQLMQDSAASDNAYGRAAMLRLKYLYAAEQFKPLLEESSAYQNDPRCEPYLAQILYISWVAARRTGSSNLESSLRKSFLDRFPDNDLGADMYFASAMQSLAGSNYQEARRLLQYIIYHYPNSHLLIRARQLDKRLRVQLEGH